MPLLMLALLTACTDTADTGPTATPVPVVYHEVTIPAGETATVVPTPPFQALLCEPASSSCIVTSPTMQFELGALTMTAPADAEYRLYWWAAD